MRCPTFLLALAAATTFASSPLRAQTAPPPAVNSTAQGSALDRIVGSGELRVCLTGDYKPFGFLRPDGQFEGIDADLAQSLATALKVKVRFVKTTWSTLMNDFIGGACDIGMGGISITLDRQMKAAFSAMTMVDGKAPIVRCADVAKYGRCSRSIARKCVRSSTRAARTSASPGRTSGRPRFASIRTT